MVCLGGFQYPTASGFLSLILVEANVRLRTSFPGPFLLNIQTHPLLNLVLHLLPCFFRFFPALFVPFSLI